MHMKDNKNFIEMMEGGFGEFSPYEVWFILTNLNNLGINTLHTQQSIDGTFYCSVDEATVRAYRKNM